MIPGTVNDVVLAIVAGAVRQFLVEENMLTDRPVVANTAVRTRKDSDNRLWGTAVTALPFEAADTSVRPAGASARG